VRRPPARRDHPTVDRAHPYLLGEMTWTRAELEEARRHEAIVVVPHRTTPRLGV
jgi:hypothetical protein